MEDIKQILEEKWGKIIIGEVKASKPSYAIFKNTSLAIEMLNKHLRNKGTIALHTDVDVDGIGSTYIMKKIIDNTSGLTSEITVINKNKVHGVHQKHVDYFNNRKIDLIIITDSSSNEIETIKGFNCDVLVIDHHEILHNEYSGKCNDGIHDFVIVNNTIDNNNIEVDLRYFKDKNIDIKETEYKGTQAMSCGLEVYELLRLYCKVYSNEQLLENLMLYQWVGVTLITDVIDLINDRNQWYIENTFYNMNTEHTLGTLMKNINKYQTKLTKSFVAFSLAPIINKAIRGGASAEVLNIVLNKPETITELSKYSDMQNNVIDKATHIEYIDELDGGVSKLPIDYKAKPYAIVDLDKLKLDDYRDKQSNYSGVIASKICNENNINTVVYSKEENGKCRGSFRGRSKGVDYRKFFEDNIINEDDFAEGHPAAFGFTMDENKLLEIMSKVNEVEPVDTDKCLISVGSVDESKRGKFHFNSIQDLVQSQGLYMMAIGNSRVTSLDEVTIRVNSHNMKLEQNKGKLYIFDYCGLKCSAFSPIDKKYVDIYPEYSTEIKLYVK